LAAFELKRFREAKDALHVAAQLASLNERLRNQDLYSNFIQECDAKLKLPQAPAAPSTKSEKKLTSKDSSVAPSASSATRSAGFAKNTCVAPKYQYYQSDKVLTISILEAGVQQQDLTVRFEPNHLVVILRKNGTDFTIIAGSLYSKIDVEKSKVVFKDEKVLIKLRKADAYEWHELLGKTNDNNTRRTTSKGVSEEALNNNSDGVAVHSQKINEAPNDCKKARPYASHRDWNAIERNILEEEKNEKPEGDEAMNQLFKQIYGDANDDTRRAMVKSFQTSGGTVLSTNWDEVKDKDYEKERTAPKGVEWKNYDGEKIPMKEDS